MSLWAFDLQVESMRCLQCHRGKIRCFHIDRALPKCMMQSLLERKRVGRHPYDTDVRVEKSHSEPAHRPRYCRLGRRSPVPGFSDRRATPCTDSVGAIYLLLRSTSSPTWILVAERLAFWQICSAVLVAPSAPGCVTDSGLPVAGGKEVCVVLHVAPASASVPGFLFDILQADDQDQEHGTTVTGPCRSSATVQVSMRIPWMTRASSQAILPVAFPAHLISPLLLKSQKCVGRP
jgi:hypothetical protein